MVDQENKTEQKRVRDIIIIGGGPAGFTAGIYSARARMDTLLVESLSVMGQAVMTDMIENYPGVEKTDGFTLVSAMKQQAQGFGLETLSATVSSIAVKEENGKRYFEVNADNDIHYALSVIIASGARPKTLNVPGEQKLTGKGVSYCATCDGPFFRGKEVMVVGGGDTAVEEALYLTRFASKVTLVHRRDRLRSVKILQERAFASDRMDFIWNSVVDSIEGEDLVTGIVLKDIQTGDIRRVDCSGVFVFIGWQPNTFFVGDLLDTDEKGAVKTERTMASSVEGIFAAGDCTENIFPQVITAAGDGAVAAYSSLKYVEKIKGTSYD